MSQDIFLAPAGSPIYGGLTPPEQSSIATPVATGGTVHALVGDWAGTGFHLLTTAPAAPILQASSHAGSVWDGANGVLWSFGAESHGFNMHNAVFGWRASDGKFLQMYHETPKATYRMASDGTYWADEEHTKPWAMHTYRRLRFRADTSEIEVMYDPEVHAGVAPIFEQAGQTTGLRVARIWLYNVKTGTWRHESFGQTAAFVGINAAFPVGYSPGYGWFTQNGAQWYRLTEAGVMSTSSVYNKSSAQYHSYMHVRDGVAYQVGGNASTLLYARHPLDNLANSTKYASSLYPALAGVTTNNCPSVMMPDGRILVFGTNAAGAYQAFILDPISNTVTDTGHVGPTLAVGNYDLAAEWSPEYRCAIILSRRFNPNRIYAYRPE